MCGLNPGCTAISSEAIGVAQRAINLTIEYAKNRKMFGKTSVDFQNTQFVLAECQTKIDAARLLVRNACVELDHRNGEKNMNEQKKRANADKLGVSVEVYALLRNTNRKIRYLTYDLKTDRVAIDSDRITIIPSREASFEQLLSVERE